MGDAFHALWAWVNLWQEDHTLSVWPHLDKCIDCKICCRIKKPRCLCVSLITSVVCCIVAHAVVIHPVLSYVVFVSQALLSLWFWRWIGGRLTLVRNVKFVWWQCGVLHSKKVFIVLNCQWDVRTGTLTSCSTGWVCGWGFTQVWRWKSEGKMDTEKYMDVSDRVWQSH